MPKSGAPQAAFLIYIHTHITYYILHMTYYILHIYLSIYLSIHLSIYLSIYISLYTYTYIYIHIYIYICTQLLVRCCRGCVDVRVGVTVVRPGPRPGVEEQCLRGAGRAGKAGQRPMAGYAGGGCSWTSLGERGPLGEPGAAEAGVGGPKTFRLAGLPSCAEVSAVRPRAQTAEARGSVPCPSPPTPAAH